MQKRLFFGLDVHSPWPDSMPEGKVVDENLRHLTLAFLGNQEWEEIENKLQHFPRPPFAIAPCGICEKLLFLPEEAPRVVACALRWEGDEVTQFYETLHRWLQLPIRPFLPHITLARSPFKKEEWIRWFHKIPFFTSAVILWESLGGHCYVPLFRYNLILPFEEKEHTADIAFCVRGKNVQELHRHAEIALALRFSKLVDFFSKKRAESFEEMIPLLNETIAKADALYGCPYKAVSWHGDIVKNTFLEWEMIVDV